MTNGNPGGKAAGKPSFLTRLFTSFRDREDHGDAPVMEMLEARVLLSASPLPVDNGQYLNDNQAVICMPLSVDDAEAAIPAANGNAAGTTDTVIEPVLVQTVTATTSSTDVNAPVITISPADGKIYKSVAIKVRVTDSDSATVNWTARLINHATGEESIIGSGGTPSSSYHTLATINGANYADGMYSVVVEAVDAAGNRSEKVHSLTLDTTPPDVSIMAESERFEVGTTAFNIVATDATEIGTRTLKVNGKTVSVNASGRAVYTFTAPGTYTFVATAKDAAGNIGTETRTIVVTENTDFNAPTIDIISPASGSYTNASKVSVIATIDDAEGGYIGWTVRLHSPNGNIRVIATGDGAVFNAEIANYGVSEGTNIFEIEAVDAAGNVTVVTRTFNVDRTKPVVTFAKGEGQMGFMNWRTGPFDLTGGITDKYSPIGQVSWKVTATSLTTGQSSVYATGSGSPASGVYTTVNPTDFASGGYKFTIEATDPAGNVGSRSLEIWMDGVPPAITSYSYQWSPVNKHQIVFNLLAVDDYNVKHANIQILGRPGHETIPPHPGPGQNDYPDEGPAVLRANLTDGPGTYVLQLCVVDNAENYDYVIVTIVKPW